MCICVDSSSETSMSDEEPEKTGSSQSSASGVVGQSATSDRATDAQASVSETQVQTVASRPSDDLSSLLEIPSDSVGQAPRYTDTGWPVTSDTATPTSVARLSTHYLPFPRQAIDYESGYDTDDDSDYDVFCNWFFPTHAELDSHSPNLNSHALLISGAGDVNDVTFTQTCLNDVHAIENILSGPIGMIPQNNISLITPRYSNTETEIEHIYSHINTRRPKKLFLYFSGHSPSTGSNHPRLNVSTCQGSALDISRLKYFIEGLLPECSDMFLILDWCDGGEYLLLPMLPHNLINNRHHAQLCSSKRGGQSYLCPGLNSLFTLYFISALTYATSCPNRNENCPLCAKFRRSMCRLGCITSRNLMEYVTNHMRHCDHSHL